jgi:aryl-alcohol dehydrogenase-like predicted oxidoreductase
MSIVGFGGYRISVQSKKHFKALKHAIESGCSLIDTSSIYTDGDSEKLVGLVLKEVEQKPTIVSKVGYIQGSVFDVVKDDEELQKDLVVFSENISHSIHPSFIENQLSTSLENLGVDCIDIYLLHNPEYYLKTENSNTDEYYARIKKAFMFLEEQVTLGKIKSYGISSNTFIDPKDDHESTNLEKVYELVKDIPNHNFKYIQFPLNLLELGALERQFDGDHLIEKAQALGLKTMINRPLNAITEQGLLRLANYEVSEVLTDEYVNSEFNRLITPLNNKWEETKEEQDEKLFEVSIMKQFSELWNKQHSVDAVEQIFFGYLFPFIAQVWGENLTAKDSQPFYELFDLSSDIARKNMNTRANDFKEQAINKGLLFENDEDLSVMAIKKYQTFGADIILVGMKDPIYVDKLKTFF